MTPRAARPRIGLLPVLFSIMVRVALVFAVAVVFVALFFAGLKR